MVNEHHASSERQGQIFDPLSPLQRIRPDLLGFIFHVSWLFLLFYGSGLNEASETGFSPTDIIYLSSALALVATFAVGLARAKAFMRACESRIGVVAAPAATALGTLLYCLDQSVPAPWLVWLAGILTGTGSAVLAARWASVFGGVSSRTIIANFTTILVAVVVICVSIGYLPRWACLALLVVLPLCSGASLQFARRYQRALPRAEKRSAEAPPRERGQASAGRNALLVVFVALIGFTVALLPSFEVVGANYGMLFYLVSAALVLGFVGVALFLADRRSFPLLFIAPLLVLLVVLLPFAQFAAGSLGDAVYPVGSVAFELMLLFGTVLFALVTDQSPARTFMVGRVTLAVSDLVGAFLGQHMLGMGDTLTVQVASVCLFASCELLLVAVVISYFANRRGKLRAEEAAVGAGGAGASLEQIAERFGLSERERDVFVLLAEGRSSARIQKDLCIAAGTVNYHTRNIYQKLDVHSRQEVIDLVHREQDV